MKKISILLMVCAAISISAQEVPTSFPRKFLIEHFTGENCGYCPGGMYAITDYILNQNPSAIWVSHHSVFGNDDYTIPENTKIGVFLYGGNGAPMMALNRTTQEQGLVFNPGYLPTITITDDTVADASVIINHTFNAATRQLDITVSGQVAHTVDTTYLLSVLIKENRLVGKQADYNYLYNCSKGGTWKEYMHNRVVRDFITATFGDTVYVKNQAYSNTFTYTVSEKWVPENCCIVAYLTPLKKQPIINAEQAPLIAGTMGGEQYYPYGITEAKGPKNTVAFDSIQTYKIDDNTLEIFLLSSTSIKTNFGSTKAVGLVYLNTEADSLVAGTYPIQADNALGTITAGYRLDEERLLGGSILTYALSSYLTQGIVTPAHMWRMNKGEMIVEEDGDIYFVFETYGGTEVTATYGSPEVAVENVVAPDAPTNKMLRNGHIIILKDGVTYDLLGNIVK
jgi:hypothetical protein